MGQFETYSYDLAGRLTSHRDFDTKVTTFTYDQLNRLLSKIPDPSFAQAPITFTYNNLGQRVTMVAVNGTSTYGYDNRNRLISKTTPKGTLTYAYNTVGNITSIRSTNSNGVTMDYAYDNLNRLQSAQDNNLATGQNQTAYNYDQVGNLQTVTLPNLVTTSYQYNSLNRLTNVNTSRTATTISSYAYTLGAAGNRLSVSELSGRVVNYAYDSIYRLTNETISGVTNPNQNGSVDYTYDEVGNRLSRNSSLAAVASQQNITVDQNDRLSSDSYDDNGSTIAADGRSYTYDFEHRIIGVTAPNLVISIVYDGDGNRVSKTVNGVTTDYLVDTNNLTGYAQVVEEIQNGVVIKQYSYGLDLISQRQLIGNDRITHFYGYDGHGSVRYLTDVTGSITDTYDFDSHGILINQTGSTPNNYLYAGEQFDHDLGLYYNRARYLDVNRSRFWSQDEYEGTNEEPQSLHKYLYAHNDPVNKIDPSGNGIIAIVALTALVLAGASIYAAGVVAPVRDPIKNAVFVTQAGVDNAEYELYWQFVNLLAAVGGIASSSALGARPFGRLSDPTERVKYAKTLKVLQEACFVADTLVKIRNGEKRIEQIEVGDEVLTKNLETNQVEFKKVNKIFVRTTKEIVTIGVSSKETLMTTPNHPFYVLRAGEFNDGDEVQYGGWVDAKNIIVGDYLLGSTGEWLQVVSISFIQSNETVYNFEVEDNHNYFVGKQGVLVHNGPCDDVIQLAGKIASKFKPEFFECLPCRKALVEAFKKEGIKGRVIEVKAKGGYDFISSTFYKNGGESITANGYHTVVEVEGYIFDTIHPYGIEKSVWENSLFARQGIEFIPGEIF